MYTHTHGTYAYIFHIVLVAHNTFPFKLFRYNSSPEGAPMVSSSSLSSAGKYLTWLKGGRCIWFIKYPDCNLSPFTSILWFTSLNTIQSYKLYE